MQSLTIIICTYNRGEMRGKCLESLANQDISLEQVPVLVVDNNSKDNTQKVALSFVPRLPSLRVAFEPKQGLSFARNKGLAEADTDWVAYLDDDAKARPDWARVILQTINSDDFDIFGGPYTAWHHFGPPPKWFDARWGAYAGSQGYGLLQPPTYIPGGNSALKRAWALELGGFSHKLGMRGAGCAYGEETALFDAMQNAGARLGFVPEMIIEHCVLPYKYTLRWQLKSAFARGRSWQKVSEAKHGRSPFLPLLWRFGVSCFLSPGKLAVRIARKKKTEHWKRIFFDVMRVPFVYAGRVAAFLS